MDPTREYFDNVATEWDAKVGPGMLVADVGTGTGFLAELALEAGARVIGVDISDGMLAQVTTRFGGRTFEARHGDTAALPLQTAEVDAVLANMVLHHAEDPPSAIREMTRALKPGGTLVITDADTHTHEWLRTEQHDRWLGFDRTDVARWFRDAGLEDVAVGDTREICSPTSTCGTQAAITIFIASGRKGS